ncbi:helix-turn-helix transcriptional regulator, partial [Streptomyces albidus (ex Kaewkla and Franco 2022)]|uniref:helix-turn-helix transcriptional regulator n=1 Tax=Streptomyces albidus (ex Kaewkla and Franco 2022) TaxID=722709 RepID=UPI001F44B543
VLADHLARGGSVVPLDGEAVGWLLGLGDAAAPDQPERAALWCAAALRQLPARGPEHTDALARLTTLVARSGQYDLLREPLTRYAAEGCTPASLPRIRLAAGLLALHTGEIPPEEPVRALLDEQILGNERNGFAAWWFGGSLTTGSPAAAAEEGSTEAPASAESSAADPAESSTAGAPAVAGAPDVPVLTAPSTPPARSAPSRPEVPDGGAELISNKHIDVMRSALDEDPAGCLGAWQRAGWAPSPELERLQRAASVIDMATMAKIVFGAGYRVPAGGVLGTYSRVVRSYSEADWSQAMSAVRELELSGARQTLVHQPARLFAADICAARGEFQQASEWLADAAPVPKFAALRAWARIGLLSCMGEDDRAVQLAVRACRWLSRAGRRPGLDLLLMRAIRTAVFIDDQVAAETLLEVIEYTHRQGAWAHMVEDVFMARSLMDRGPVHIEVAADLARGRGDLPSLVEFCLAAAQFADDPRPWLREAHELAVRCGASALLERIRTVTRERGVPAPRSRGRRQKPADTERRVIELIQNGLTNRQIALRLQVSEKTVEYCLTRLFARTGCRSRVELAAASLEGRLPQEAGWTRIGPLPGSKMPVQGPTRAHVADV